MSTEVVAVDPESPQSDAIGRAAEVIRRGGLVAFPTETVYGLGADALSETAVLRIFAAKGRPANNPLIVHVLDVAAARELTTAWPAVADQLAAAFWPGPLSIVLPKSSHVPDAVTAGGPTVALRIPNHPVARALIAASGRPLAAPSANPSTRVSSVRAEHVMQGLVGKVDMILDAGRTSGGLESTVVDLSGDAPRLLRPGLIDEQQLRRVLTAAPLWDCRHAQTTDAALPSPGMLAKHYSPSVPVHLTPGSGRDEVFRRAATGRVIGWILRETALSAVGPLPPNVRPVELGNEPAVYAARLYDTLHALESAGVDEIVVELPPDEVAWRAARDRLQRAAAE